MVKKSYQEVVRGIRSSKEPTMYISEVLTEIRQEIKGTDRNDKVACLQKLLYLNLLGYSFDWAEFHVIEVMSQAMYRERRVGYLAATVLIRPDSELFILCANSLKKAFLSKNKYDVGLALDCFSMVVTEELAHDLLPDILSLLKSKRAFVRRKAILCLFRIYKQYPTSLEECYDHLVSLLVDADISVQSSAVSVITELARIDPDRYQTLAPTIFTLLVNVDNTWILIKVIKLLMSLVTKEPRLAKKILDPLVKVLRTAETKSLLYEAISGVTQCLIYMTVKSGSKLEKEVNKVAELEMTRLMEFVEDVDPNLKYLGLCGLMKLVQVAPIVVAKKSFVFVSCLKANDSTIRSKALHLIQAIANPKNLKNLVEDLVTCLHSGIEREMREDIIFGVIDMCSRDMYKNMTDFAWYVAVLVDLACTCGSNHGELISTQLIDISLRVPAIRLFTVNSVLPLLLQPTLLSDSMYTVLIGAAWVVGEYSGYLQQEQIAEVFTSLASSSVMYLSNSIQAIILQSLLQVSLRFICSLGSATEQAILIKQSVINHAGLFLSSESDEVRYRAALLREVLSSTTSFENEIVTIESHEDVQREIEKMSSERKGLTSMNEKTETVIITEKVDVDINLGKVIESGIVETPKSDTPRDDTPKDDDTPRGDDDHDDHHHGITQLSILLERLTEELLPISSKAQRKVKLPEGLDLNINLCTFTLEKEVEKTSTIAFIDGPLFTYVSTHGDGHRHSRRNKKNNGEKKKKSEFYLEGEDEEGEILELSLDEVGIPVIVGEKEEKSVVKFMVLGDAEEESTEEEKEEKKEKKKEKDDGERKHRSHRSHRSEEKEEKKEEEKEGEKKHRRRHH